MLPKSSKLLLTVLSGITFLLQGCASGIPFSGLAPIPENRALLYLYREGRIVGAAGSNEIYVNGKPTVDLKSGGYFVVDIDAGPVAISHRPTEYTLLNVIDRSLNPSSANADARPFHRADFPRPAASGERSCQTLSAWRRQASQTSRP